MFLLLPVALENNDSFVCGDYVVYPSANSIEVIDSGGNNYPDNTLTFKFIANNSFYLLSLSNTP
jgi:hypothetical protein